MPRAAILLAAATAATAAAALLLLSGCTTAVSMPTPTGTASPTPTRTPLGDGILRIGTLFPATGATDFLAAPQVAAVKVAVAEINAAGGVNGKPVEIVSDDSGDATTATAEASLADFVTKGVDVIIGPDSSVLAQRLLVPAQKARIPMISPAATYPQLSTLDGAPGAASTSAADGQIFFRTIPSAAHQGVALGTLLPSKGESKVALVTTGDVLGQSIVSPLTDTLQAHGGSLVANVGLTAASDAAAVAAQVKAAAPDAVVLDTADNGTQTKALIAQLTAAGYSGAKLWLTSDNLADYSQALPAGMLNGSSGILEGADTSAPLQAAVKAIDPSVATFQYVPETYDATILAALAANLAHDDNGLRVAARLRAASVGGIKCTSYAECLDVLKTEPAIDYDGVSGTLNLDAAGDPTSATYGVFTYDANNMYARSANITG